MNPWIVRIGIIAVILFLLDREIYLYEGVHLGSRVQGWLYDRWAAKYDKDKRDSQRHDADMLARPLVAALAEHQPDTPDALLLDIATGTGRLPVALLHEAEFRGHIVGLDISREMMALAARKVPTSQAARVTWVQHSAVPLPFPDASFDVVCCLEALEIMPNMYGPLAEMTRVLRPGGILLTTHGTPELGMWRKVISAEQFTTMLEAAGFELVEILPWWKSFDRVWARKRGDSTPVGARPITDVLRCPTCGAVALTLAADGELVCGACQSALVTTSDGVIVAE